MIMFLEYPKCSTCRKAKKWLDDHGMSYTDRHIIADRPTADELKTWQKKSGLPLRKFFNTSGQLYREMNLKERLDGMSEEEQFELLASDGMLVKRPLLILDKTVLVGFKEAEWMEKL